MQGNTDLRTVKVTHLWFLSRKVMKPFNTTQIKGKTNSTVVSYFAIFYTCQQLIWLLVCYRWESLKCRAMCCCRGRGSSWRTGGTAGAYEDDTQTARARLPTPAWQTVGTGLSWAAGWSLFPRPVETKQRGSWRAGTCLSGKQSQLQNIK